MYLGSQLVFSLIKNFKFKFSVAIDDNIEAIKKKHSDWPVTEITETVKRFDVNNDGKISREEVTAAFVPLDLPFAATL